MEGRPPKPRIGNLVRIDKGYPNIEAAGRLALVIKTLGIECVVQPVGMSPDAKPWWFSRGDLEVV
jgi:hypothetical protein